MSKLKVEKIGELSSERAGLIVIGLLLLFSYAMFKWTSYEILAYISAGFAILIALVIAILDLIILFINTLKSTAEGAINTLNSSHKNTLDEIRKTDKDRITLLEERHEISTRKLMGDVIKNNSASTVGESDLEPDLDGEYGDYSAEK